MRTKMSRAPGKRNLKNYEPRITYLDGKPINWRKPPAPNKMVLWTKKTTSGRQIRGSFRTICHMDRLNRLAYLRWGVGVSVIQPDWNTGVAASAGTHDFDATWDLWIAGVDPWEQQRFFRRNGMGGWMRKPPLFGWHYHGFTLPPREGSTVSDDFKVHGFKVGKYVDGGFSLFGRLVTSSQISDYYQKAFGLSGQHTPGSDTSWFPKNISGTIFNLNKFVEARAEEQRIAATRTRLRARLSELRTKVQNVKDRLAALK